MAIQIYPIYGVEPYLDLGVPAAADFGGGAKVTNENLLITLWTKPGDLSVPGQLIKPALYDEDAVVSAYGNGALKQCARSRLSARFAFSGANDQAPNPLLGILNPPPELKQAFASIEDPSASSFGLNSGMAVFNPLMWEVGVTDEDWGLLGAETQISWEAVFAGSVVPFARTNGADGVWPTFYDMSTPAALAATLAEMRAGAPFYITVLCTLPAIETGIVTVRWPFSGSARG